MPSTPQPPLADVTIGWEAASGAARPGCAGWFLPVRAAEPVLIGLPFISSWARRIRWPAARQAVVLAAPVMRWMLPGAKNSATGTVPAMTPMN